MEFEKAIYYYHDNGIDELEWELHAEVDFDSGSADYTDHGDNITFREYHPAYVEINDVTIIRYPSDLLGYFSLLQVEEKILKDPFFLGELEEEAADIIASQLSEREEAIAELKFDQMQERRLGF